MSRAVPLTLELNLGPQGYPEELDGAARRLRRHLRDQGLEVTLATEAAPLGAKASVGDQPGQLEVGALPDQFTVLVGALGQWVSHDPDRAATLRQLPPDLWGQLAALVVTMMPRLPARLARFTYQDGARSVTLEYDPDRTDPRQLLAEIQSTLAGGVHIVAQGDITIGGSVTGRDLNVNGALGA